ncbi:hypothetical protein jhhlp_007512 [Lomentospora prolificans]|uniref:transketolase n=1 Tax=Lomentospora prolificans TaxID=41688 RepID=A0A2N3N193_9PEZI|nr:hypothetical protein jhhlp_007512 [Lomentospora prolificans]
MSPSAIFESPAPIVAPTKNNGVQKLKDGDKVDLVLRVFRCLIADICQQYNGGHPGGAMGMAAIGIALWKYTMKYSPKNPSWFNRDRFVLSNGHTCLFQYTFLHLVGYQNMTMDQLKSYHSTQPESLCPGHPEIEIDGIEVTTGPLGQGVANAVGLAMASKHLGKVYNRPRFDLAGHWKLNNLVVIYDNNQITCDGSVDLCNTEDVNARMRACNWNVIDVEDGCFNVEGLVEALAQAKAATDKPTFINVRTVIGIGSKEVYDFFGELTPKGVELEKSWNDLIAAYTAEHPDVAAEFKLRVEGKPTSDWRSIIPSKDQLPEEPTASRKSAGIVCNPLAAETQNMMVGTADLSPSVNMIWKGKVDFQHPELKTTRGINGSYSGRYIHYGIREHAMAAISNGLAAFSKGTILPVTSSFFMFYIYAAPGICMGALQGLQQIHIATHDSIGTGEDGPTHQPIELAALYRAMPNILYIRPCDGEEVAGAFIAALEAKSTPSIISLSRQGLEQYLDHSSRDGVLRGGYVFMEDEAADVTLIGVGAEMCFAVKTRKVLAAKHNVRARIVSVPCQRIFEKQAIEYKRQVLRSRSTPVIAVEAYAMNGWERYADAGYGMTSFGHSLPCKAAYKYFGFDEEVIAPVVAKFVEEAKANGLESLRGEFKDLNPIKRNHFDY